MVYATAEIPYPTIFRRHGVQQDHKLHLIGMIKLFKRRKKASQNRSM